VTTPARSRRIEASENDWSLASGTRSTRVHSALDSRSQTAAYPTTNAPVSRKKGRHPPASGPTSGRATANTVALPSVAPRMNTDDIVPDRSAGNSSETSLGSPNVIAVPPTPSSSVGTRTVTNPVETPRRRCAVPITIRPAPTDCREPIRSIASPDSSASGT